MKNFEIEFGLVVVEKKGQRNGNTSIRIITAQDKKITAKIAEAMLGGIAYQLSGEVYLYFKEVLSVKPTKDKPCIPISLKTWIRVYKRLGLGSLLDKSAKFVTDSSKVKINGIAFTPSQRRRVLLKKIPPAKILSSR